MSALQQWFARQGIADLWNDTVAENEDILFSLAREKCWDDIALLCENELKLPKIPTIKLKAFFIKWQSTLDRASSPSSPQQPASVPREDDTKQQSSPSQSLSAQQPQQAPAAKTESTDKDKSDEKAGGSNKKNRKKSKKSPAKQQQQESHEKAAQSKSNKKKRNQNKSKKKENQKSKSKSTSSSSSPPSTSKTQDDDAPQPSPQSPNNDVAASNVKEDKEESNQSLAADVQSILSKIEIADIKEAEYQTFYALNGYQYASIPVVDLSNVDDESSYMEYFNKRQCCILRGASLLEEIRNKWSMQYLAQTLPNNKFNVKVSSTREFRGYRADRNFGKYSFDAPNETVEMSMLQFISNVVESRQKLDKSSKFSNSSYVMSTNQQGEATSDRTEEECNYYQLESSLGSQCELAMDIDRGLDKMNWNECVEIVRKCGWGTVMANNLSIGMKGNLVPLHYQQNENIYVSLRGYTEFVLFAPQCSNHLYGFPYGHPCYRQSMVNAEFADENALFANFKSTDKEPWTGNVYRGVLQPGDLIYIPSLWWSEMVHLNDFTMNITFCNKMNYARHRSRQLDGGEKRADIEQILNRKTVQQRIAIAQNIERMVLCKYGAHRNATANIFKSFLDENGKYTKHRNDIRKLLRNVFNKEEIDQFVLELVDGRYNVDCHQFIKRQCLHKTVRK